MTRVWLIVGIGIAVLAALVFWLAGQRPGVLADEDSQMRLTYLVILLVFVGSSLLIRRRQIPAMKWLKHGLVWAALGMALVVGYSYRGEMSSLWSRTMGELMPGRVVELDAGTAVVRSGEDGHFRLDATVDGTPIRFLLDTGASMVVLNRRDARMLGINLATLSFTQRTQTANGVGLGALVGLKEIRVGPVAVRNIRAMVNKAPMSTSLLGTNFLERLSGYSVKDGKLTLRQ